MNNIAKNLKRLRQRADMTQDGLAEKLHVTRQAVSNWETDRNQPDIDMLMAIADALGTDMNEIIYGEKPAAYERFQKKYIVWSCICAGFVLLALLLHITLVPYLRWLRNDNYIDNPVWIYMSVMKPAAAFAFGMLLPALLSVWKDIRTAPRIRKIFSIAGIVLLLPAALQLLQTLVLLIWPDAPQPVFYLLPVTAMDRRMPANIIMYLLPFLSGIAVFFGCSK